MPRRAPLASLALIIALAVGGRRAAFAAPPASVDPRASEIPSGELREALSHLRVLGTVMYVGAHPDDDNTSLLAYLARGRGLRTSYLSLTRGDGGQNILGTETGEALGVLRTQELLASRRVDGAGQLFGRALDFGFSKSPDEALSFWGHDRTLADMVWLIRLYQPDVIITRFGTDGSGGHGHHTASAILAGEAFRAAADSSRFPDQLTEVTTWRAKRLLWNTWAPKLEGRGAGAPPLLTLETGGIDPELGASYPEIGGRARSLNRSQGAGTPERHAKVTEYFEQVDGNVAQHDPLEGVTLGWSRVPGGAAVDSLLARAEREFDPAHPETVLPLLARAQVVMCDLLPRAGASEPLVSYEIAELQRVMRAAAGLWLEATVPVASVCPGDTVTLTVSAVRRGGAAVRLAGIHPPFAARAFYRREEGAASPAGSAAIGPAHPAVADSSAPADHAARELPANAPVVALARMIVPADAPFSQPYWLDGRIANPAGVVEWRGEAERPGPMARIDVDVANVILSYDVPVVYRWIDRVYGDRYRALEVLPPVTCRLDQPVYLFATAAPREISCTVQSTHLAQRGTLHLRLPRGWSAAPESTAFALDAGAEQTLRFRVTPAPGAASGPVHAEAVVAGRAYRLSLQHIDYPHVPIQALLAPAESKLMRADVRARAGTIGYLAGSGDEIPAALGQMGFHVVPLSDDEVENSDLARFSCIVTGVRAYNVRPRLVALVPRLLEYVKNGGRLITQYVTPDAALDDRLGPWPLKISRDRITDETAEMTLLKPAHPLLTTPNQIGAADFAGWVQERGLYYAGPYDARYVALIAAHDPGEQPLAGGLVAGAYGKGEFVYTGLAFFRQLPAGVPGAWRLFANLVSRGR